MLPNVMRVYSHLLAFDEPNKRFNLVPCDSEGRLYVSSGSTKSIGQRQSLVWVTSEGVTIVNNNPDRKRIILSNNGCVTVYLFMPMVEIVGSALRLYPGASYMDDINTREIKGMTNYHTSYVSVTEFL